jgi:hypothetical protein
MSPASDERARIRAGIERVLAETPERSNGALTIVALATEAGVPRNALTQWHTDLKDEFYRRVRGARRGKRRRGPPPRYRRQAEADDRQQEQGTRPAPR